ncbi:MULTISPECIES: hypothetical protein [unclassified Achromobacter]|uniref:hypothetical protein n=1 Tax=unclassified Achromobacter TaxID=2626865 RepID=UPI00117765AB|nr:MULTISPECIES: hypothetical protein [unclassified Achromobacter]
MDNALFCPVACDRDAINPSRLTNGWNTLRTSGLLARLEQPFIDWQAGRLRMLSPERLWAAAMTDPRSLAEIRRSHHATER